MTTKPTTTRVVHIEPPLLHRETTMKCSRSTEKLFARHIQDIWNAIDECYQRQDYEEADRLYDHHLGRAYADYFTVTGLQYGLVH